MALKTPESEEFGARVRAAREQIEGLTQERMAHASGVTSSYYSNLERGLANPTFDVIVTIADQVNVDPAELMRGLKPSGLRRRGTS
ncbi:helix-turn-helix domain-containing protein [Amycolatopsis pithecellobii]|uniref:helix-turn-helix domain-containing protein n=1 Tax=Amycolatopsis pithecellobii TaxID=664692 RepID=UPI0014081968|nr:helix-turn-helix transcriptional regulator [Amycolatopsis pithecellobii]